jgi:(+)-abscisic acid 8'-hydroxylase
MNELEGDSVYGIQAVFERLLSLSLSLPPPTFPFTHPLFFLSLLFFFFLATTTIWTVEVSYSIPPINTSSSSLVFPTQVSSLLTHKKEKNKATEMEFSPSVFFLSFASILLLVGGLLFKSLLKFFASDRPQSLPLPPGTMGWPYMGETFQLYSQDPNVFFASKRKRYGSIFKTHILGCPCVMISSPEAAKFVLVTKSHLFKPTFPASKEKMLGKEAIFFHQGAYHMKLRKLVLRAFLPEAIKNIVPDIQNIAKDSLQYWEGRLINTFQEMKSVSFYLFPFP